MEENTHIHKSSVKRTFPVTGMSCASCAASVASVLEHTTGVENATVNFAANTVLVEYSPEVSADTLQKAVQSAGFDLITDEEDPLQKQDELQQQHYKNQKQQFWGALIFTLPIFVLGMFFMDWVPGRWISLVLSIPVLAWFGRHFFLNAWKQAKNLKANMDTLVALSTGIAFLFSLFNTLFPAFWHARGIHPHVYYEAATVIITFISLGKLLEEKAKAGTSSAIRKLMGMQPSTVLVSTEEGEVEMSLKEVQKGFEILVRPGDKIPVDGVVLQGNTYIDESMITGEPVPVEKVQGTKVYTGTINQMGSFRFRAEKVGEDTLLFQIIRMVQEAQGSKAPVQNLVDKIAGVFVPVVMGIAILTFMIWMLVGGENAFTHALLTSVSVLVIACPCALGLATPTAIMVGIGKGAEHNILIRDAVSLENGHKVNAIVLDKTGTITKGKPLVVDQFWMPDADQSGLLALELASSHPLATAVVDHLQTNSTKSLSLEKFENITGQGVVGWTLDGKKYLAGNRKLMSENAILFDSETEKVADNWRSEAKTLVYYAVDQNIHGVLAIADEVKDGSVKAIDDLKKMDIEVYMLTGDSHETAKEVAINAGIDHFKAEVMPTDKQEFVKELQQQGKVVAMVGDGINDSQALAQADVSIAMGKGSDIAMDVANMTLITSDLRAVPQAFHLSGITVRGIRQNLFWAFIYNLVGIPIAAGVLYPVNGFLLDPMIAGAAMAFSSVSVVMNSLRLKMIKL